MANVKAPWLPRRICQRSSCQASNDNKKFEVPQMISKHITCMIITDPKSDIVPEIRGTMAPNWES